MPSGQKIFLEVEDDCPICTAEARGDPSKMGKIIKVDTFRTAGAAPPHYVGKKWLCERGHSFAERYTITRAQDERPKMAENIILEEDTTGNHGTTCQCGACPTRKRGI